MDIGTPNEWLDIAKEQQPGAPDNCIPRFFIDAVPDKARSEEQGRQCFREVEKVEIIIPGDKNNRPIHKVNDEHRRRWPDAYAKFQKTREETYGDGTPLEQYPALSKAMVLEMKAMGILTVEALAGLDDQAAENIRGGRQIRERARQYIQPPSETEAELRKTVHDQAQTISEMKTRIDTLERQAVEGEQTKPKRGRPKKADAEAEG